MCGTEEGNIHKCSVSYNEQYLFTYEGHTGPVYKLAWSPFSKDVFLSSSGDWTMRLWKADRALPSITFNSTNVCIFFIIIIFFINIDFFRNLCMIYHGLHQALLYFAV